MSEPVVVLIHGTEGTPQSNWLPWLAGELTSRNIKTIRPALPTPDGQTLANWRKEYHRTMDEASTARDNPISPAQTILVGHSIGAPFVLRLAEEVGLGNPMPYRAVIGVCPFAEQLGLEQFDPLNQSFVTPAWDWNAVCNGAREFLFLASSDDPFVSLSHARNVQEAVGCGTLEVVEKGGHLTSDSGFKEFPALLEKILRLTGTPTGTATS